jgi:hypothetical protein
MNNDITISCNIRVGTGFVPQEYLKPGEDEYRLRNLQLEHRGIDPRSFRPLQPFELETLVRNHNTCSDWSLFLVSDPFTPELIHNSFFSGLVRIGRLERVSLEHHDLHLFAGISNSQIIACDIGDNCVITNCTYIAHYIIGEYCILIDNAEIHVSNHAKFGNGGVMEGEKEDVRITIDVMNESGGRPILPFDGMTTADAYLWARHREKKPLMERFQAMAEAVFGKRRGTYGVIGNGSVLKSNGVIKDVAIGESAYIKGSNKLKNLTVNSSEKARTQIGEGVELVNGIIGYGCKVFYGCKAVRFVMGDNSALKYGARLIHSVLGENSTVSCCEILNNLIFPAHEQHHNTSFLIASLVKGQSNMAAGATIGSNHNSRAPDGEIEAGRGFWPGLCTSVKHSSRFASFCLLAKGDYRYELDIPFPFCLVDNDYKRDRLLISPAYWWISNLYALMRNEAKFESRDKRFDKSVCFEYSPFAPDTAQEILQALEILETMAGLSYQRYRNGPDYDPNRDIALATEKIGSDPRTLGRAILAECSDPLPFETLAEKIEHSDRQCVIKRPAKAWKAYRDILLWFAGREVEKALSGLQSLDFDTLRQTLDPDSKGPMKGKWENLGGLLVYEPRLEALLNHVIDGSCPTWNDLHDQYRRLSKCYAADKAAYAWTILGYLYPPSSASAADKVGPDKAGPDNEGLRLALADLRRVADYIDRGVLSSRAKDWENPFRKATYRSAEEMTAVLGKPEENSFVQRTREEMAALRSLLDSL